MDSRPELLAASRDSAALRTLVEGLAEHGVATDLVAGLTEAREAFFSRGGHRLLLLGPDLSPGEAREVAVSLTDVDPQLRVLVFGDEFLREAMPRRIPFHPSSRAALGAVLKALYEC